MSQSLQPSPGRVTNDHVARQCRRVEPSRVALQSATVSQMAARLHGRITQWFEDRGYGFITASGGSKQVFLHITALSDRGVRPKVGDIVTFFLSHDKQGRPRAMAVERAARGDASAEPPAASCWVPVLVVGVVVGLALAARVPWWFVPLYAGGSFFTWLIYAWDKSRAQMRGWRVAEDTLHLLSLLGGWPGAFVAQQQFRHKTGKRSFRVVFWLTVLINVAILGSTAVKGSVPFLKSTYATGGYEISDRVWE